MKPMNLMTSKQRNRVRAIKVSSAKPTITLMVEYPRAFWRWSAYNNVRLHGWTLAAHESLSPCWVRATFTQNVPTLSSTP